MGVEIAESELAHVPTETGNEGNSSLKENGKINQVTGIAEPIKFGSHSVDETVKGEAKKVPEANFPKDAVEEWPAPKQIHSFYFVKYRSFDDPKLKSKLDLAEKELQKKNQARSQILEKLKARRADRFELITQKQSLSAENEQYRSVIDEKRKEMEPLQQALGKLRGSNTGRERGSGLCSSEEELDELINSLHYRIQHESITLNEEKQIVREIRQLEATRNKVRENAAERTKIQASLGEKEVIQNQVKLIGVDLDGVRKEQQVVKAKRKQLNDEIDAITKEIKTLEEELTMVSEKRDKTFENIQELRKQRDEGNSSFFQNRTLLNKAREFAAKKDIEALQELSIAEVDKFMSLWSGSKAFRDDYERRILMSLDMRQLSRDGRMRNPGEKPLVLVEATTQVEPEVVAKANPKPAKEAPVAPPPDNDSQIQKVQKEKNKKQKEGSNKVTARKEFDFEDGEEISGSKTLEKSPAPVRNEVDEVKLKEMKREEELAKAKQAMERKKKLADKAAAKAAIKAQKEAEKKLKEREKRAKKKAGASVAVQESEEQTELVEEVAEPEKVEEKVETPVVSKSRERKESTLRNRSRKGSDLPKVLLKRKKATNYWMWAAPAALAAMLILVGFYYFL